MSVCLKIGTQVVKKQKTKKQLLPHSSRSHIKEIKISGFESLDGKLY